MSLPPGFLDELRTRTSLAQVVGRKVMWDARKSNQGKGDMWAPCPFHQEKTASFHVDDRKGFYHCFGCHAKGDAISFVRETENVGFMEAVEILAREAGMQMPARDPQAQQRASRRSQLAEVMEQAVQYFRLQLKTAKAAPARDYLARRGLDAQALERWEIGFAQDDWRGLLEHLTGKGTDPQLILGAGLAKPPSKGSGQPYDTFRNRIIYPIRDARGTCIAFGGRAMDPDNPAKYLNSPETELFDKGRSLYNHAPARAAAGKGHQLIVAEGYMDVIALVSAGFEAAVAPLGTAVTEDQLRLLWRIAPEPIVALDGDRAGLQAAMRLMDLALPLLEAGQSLRFVLLPEKTDPDDLIRASGPGAMQALIDEALPMAELLWRRETEGRVFDSPERRAALEKSLRDKTARIADVTIRGHYERAMKDRMWELFSPRRGASGQGGRKGQRGGGWAKNAPAAPMPSTRSSLLVAAGDEAAMRLRVSVVLAVILRCPGLLDEFDYELEHLDCGDEDLARIRDAILMMPRDADPAAEAASRAGPEAVDKLLGATHLSVVPCLRKPEDTGLARQTVREELAKIKAFKGQSLEIAEAEEDITGAADEAVTWRLSQAAEAARRAERSEQEDKTHYERGANGARISRDERDRLDALLKQIGFSSGD